MNWKKIQQAWEAGDKEIAIRLLQSMLYELKLKQRSLLDFKGKEFLNREKKEKYAAHP
jgi:hypothetical protein